MGNTTPTPRLRTPGVIAAVLQSPASPCAAHVLATRKHIQPFCPRWRTLRLYDRRAVAMMVRHESQRH